MLSPISLAEPRAGDGVRILALAQSFCKEAELTLASPTPLDRIPPELNGLVDHWPISLKRRGNIATAIRATVPTITYDQARYRYRVDLPRVISDTYDAAYIHLPQGWSLWEVVQRRVRAGVVVTDVQNDELDMWLQRGAAEKHWVLRQACLRFAKRSDARTRRMVSGSDLIMVVSDRDGKTLQQRLGPTVAQKLRMVPNGVDVAYFTSSGTRSRRRRSAVFIGSLDTRMNQKAARELLDVWPSVVSRLPDATLTIAGRNPPPWLVRGANQSVRVVASPQDVRPYLWEAGAFVAPFQAGGGTKIKILEAMAAGAPIVAMPSGVQGLGLVAHKHYIPIDRIEDLPAALTDLERDGEADAIAREAADIASKHDWAAVGLEAVEDVRAASGRR
jgi:glycosyltransferase involved in cell wall biosynthesis